MKEAATGGNFHDMMYDSGLFDLTAKLPARPAWGRLQEAYSITETAAAFEDVEAGLGSLILLKDLFVLHFVFDVVFPTNCHKALLLSGVKWENAWGEFGGVIDELFGSEYDVDAMQQIRYRVELGCKTFMLLSGVGSWDGSSWRVFFELADVLRFPAVELLVLKFGGRTDFGSVAKRIGRERLEAALVSGRLQRVSLLAFSLFSGLPPLDLNLPDPWAFFGLMAESDAGKAALEAVGEGLQSFAEKFAQFSSVQIPDPTLGFLRAVADLSVAEVAEAQAANRQLRDGFRGAVAALRDAEANGAGDSVLRHLLAEVRLANMRWTESYRALPALRELLVQEGTESGDAALSELCARLVVGAYSLSAVFPLVTEAKAVLSGILAGLPGSFRARDRLREALVIGGAVAIAGESSTSLGLSALRRYVVGVQGNGCVVTEALFRRPWFLRGYSQLGSTCSPDSALTVRHQDLVLRDLANRRRIEQTAAFVAELRASLEATPSARERGAATAVGALRGLPYAASELTNFAKRSSLAGKLATLAEAAELSLEDATALAEVDSALKDVSSCGTLGFGPCLESWPHSLEACARHCPDALGDIVRAQATRPAYVLERMIDGVVESVDAVPELLLVVKRSGCLLAGLRVVESDFESARAGDVLILGEARVPFLVPQSPIPLDRLPMAGAPLDDLWQGLSAFHSQAVVAVVETTEAAAVRRGARGLSGAALAQWRTGTSVVCQESWRVATWSVIPLVEVEARLGVFRYPVRDFEPRRPWSEPTARVRRRLDAAAGTKAPSPPRPLAACPRRVFEEEGWGQFPWGGFAVIDIPVAVG